MQLPNTIVPFEFEGIIQGIHFLDITNYDLPIVISLTAHSVKLLHDVARVPSEKMKTSQTAASPTHLTHSRAHVCTRYIHRGCKTGVDNNAFTVRHVRVTQKAGDAHHGARGCGPAHRTADYMHTVDARLHARF